MAALVPVVLRVIVGEIVDGPLVNEVVIAAVAATEAVTMAATTEKQISNFIGEWD